MTQKQIKIEFMLFVSFFLNSVLHIPLSFPLPLSSTQTHERGGGRRESGIVSERGVGEREYFRVSRVAKRETKEGRGGW